MVDSLMICPLCEGIDLEGPYTPINEGDPIAWCNTCNTWLERIHVMERVKPKDTK